MHACFSLVIPASEMSGSSDGLIRFPSWFGRNSKATRFNRYYKILIIIITITRSIVIILINFTNILFVMLPD